MHKYTIRIAVAVALLSLSAVALSGTPNGRGQYRYKWRDSSGLLHYSDSITSEALAHGYDIVNDQGVVVGHVKRQLTAEERKAAAAKAEQLAAAEEARRQQESEDRHLLAAYPDEQTFRDAQQAEIDNLTQTMRTTDMNLRSQEQNLAELLSHAADIERSGKTVPKDLGDRIATQRQAVAEQRQTLQRQETAKAVARRKAETELQRYRALRKEEQERSGD